MFPKFDILLMPPRRVGNSHLVVQRDSQAVMDAPGYPNAHRFEPSRLPASPNAC